MQRWGKSLRRLGLPAVVCVAMLAGCGGSSAPSDSAFISKLNAFCTSFQTKLNAVPQPTGSSAAEITAYLQSALPVLEQGLSGAQAITASSSKATQYKAMLANLEQQIATTKHAVAAGQAGDTATINSDLDQLKTLSSQGDQQAQAIGATACVSGSSTNSSGGGTATTTTG
jgi:hypothetical protein